MDITVVKIEFSFSVHATEDLKKNMEATMKIIPQTNFEQAIIKQEELEGGYGNPIEFFQISFTRKKDIDSILGNIASKLSQEDKLQLTEEFDKRFDSRKNTFYLRLDKESVYKNKFPISTSSNVFKIAIKMRSFIKEDGNFKSLLIDKGILHEK